MLHSKCPWHVEDSDKPRQLQSNSRTALLRGHNLVTTAPRRVCRGEILEQGHTTWTPWGEAKMLLIVDLRLLPLRPPPLSPPTERKLQPEYI